MCHVCDHWKRVKKGRKVMHGVFLILLYVKVQLACNHDDDSTCVLGNKEILCSQPDATKLSG